MIEAIAAAVQKAAEATAVAAKEGVTKVGVQEIGRASLGGDTGKLAVGGDLKSVLSAMEVDPEALGAEVRRAGSVAEAMEHVPLEDSKGEVRHHLSPEEAAHYENIGLRAHEVGGRECLVRDDIDWEQRDDSYGLTNKELAERGLSPRDPEGRPYELHHIQQRSDGMLAELSRDEHTGPGSYRILHDPMKRSEVDHGPEWDKTRAEHWRARAAEVKS